ncbi:transmembrane protein, putative (macronuclear) [Tetrahymena thermophila SB210]|uniref:Transmembrane protein, putative n=1 Tax=Tetrahymena thermophila (strain SB210) TaxID=312017 RepID=W7XKD6_TETTS|nr:transmembrane protein, putative [Tetrahymena thermophila SB210]EWS74809.1 transmembrane protein, putative [Tetrahymena thermophila SB210]|eukprot:XP_012652640.1 transmembrane protein, putative [Tetrahymena thermophila SB210]
MQEGQIILSDNDFTNINIQPAVYIQAKQIKLNSSSFKGNNYNQNSFQGGFLQIFTNYLAVIETNFINSLAENGAAMSINPNTKNANFTFINCLFQNLIALKNGAAVYIRQALNQTQMNFNNCTFNNILSQYGGCVYVAYPMNSLEIQYFYLVYPQITFQGCTSSHVYAQQGGYIFSQNANINLYNHTSLTNNPNNLSSINYIILQSLNQLSFLGEYIYLSQSYFTAEKINIYDHSAIQGRYYITQLNPVFLNAVTNSNVTIKKTEINSCQFLQSGFIQLIQSSLEISESNIKNLMFQQNGQRLMQTNINLQISTKFSAIIISQSQINLQKLLIYNTTCTHESCIGGAMLLENSGGSISSCNFIQNFCYGNGGALSILGLNQNLTIYNSVIMNNRAQKGNGGGISFIYDQNLFQLAILNSSISQNFAELGGGLHFEFQKLPLRNQYLAYLNNSILIQNQVSQFGGGIYYIGKKPYVNLQTEVSQNTAESPFGKDYFSQPKELSLNLQLSQHMFNYSFYWLNTGEKVYKIKNQVSGQKLPNIIFQMIDESGSIINNQYLQLAQAQQLDLQLNVNKAENMNNISFALVSSQKSFQFNNLYNLSNLIVIGQPGTSVFLNLTINGIQQKINNAYKIILQIQLRPCQRGEVYGKFIDQTQNQSKTYYECQKCKEGTYSLAYPSLKNTEIQCQKCIDFAECEGGDILNISEGFWRMNDQTDEVIECVNAPQNCLGGKGNNTCSKSHIGPLCENCDLKNNYSNISDYDCDYCGSPFINSLKILSLMTFYVTTNLKKKLQKQIFLYKKILFAKISADSVLNKLVQGISVNNNVQKSNKQLMDTSVLLKQVLNYFQIIVVLTTFQLKIPNMFVVSVDIIANPTTQILYSFQCFFYQLYLKTGLNMIYLQLIASVALPIILIIIFLVSGGIIYRKDPYRRPIYLYTSFLYCFIYFQPSIFNRSISLVTCRQIGKIYQIRDFNKFFKIIKTKRKNKLHFVQQLK